VSEERQTFVHPVFDATVIVRELFIAVRYAQFGQSPCKSAGAIEQVELILFTTVDIQGLNPSYSAHARDSLADVA
jgi:hypothetical protein